MMFRNALAWRRLSDAVRTTQNGKQAKEQGEKRGVVGGKGGGGRGSSRFGTHLGLATDKAIPA